MDLILNNERALKRSFKDFRYIQKWSMWAAMESNHAPLTYSSRDLIVGAPGIEPGTSFLSGKRSTTEPRTHELNVATDISSVKRSLSGKRFYTRNYRRIISSASRWTSSPCFKNVGYILLKKSIKNHFRFLLYQFLIPISTVRGAGAIREDCSTSCAHHSAPHNYPSPSFQCGTKLFSPERKSPALAISKKPLKRRFFLCLFFGIFTFLTTKKSSLRRISSSCLAGLLDNQKVKGKCGNWF